MDDASRRALVGNSHVVVEKGMSLPPEADAKDRANYAPYIGAEYAPDLCCEESLKFIRDHRDKPFFVYYPTTIPHLALVFAFTSDNGAVYPLSGTDPTLFRSNGELRGHKGDIYEGSVRAPLIVRWKGRIAPGSASDRFPDSKTGSQPWSNSPGRPALRRRILRISMGSVLFRLSWARNKSRVRGSTASSPALAGSKRCGVASGSWCGGT